MNDWIVIKIASAIVFSWMLGILIVGSLQGNWGVLLALFGTITMAIVYFIADEKEFNEWKKSRLLGKEAEKK